MSGVFLSTLDSGMLNVALPSIMRSFQLTLEHTEFVVTVYLFTITSSLVFWGRLSDRLGRGVIYLTGLGLFAAGALACYFAASFSLLLFCRFMQALGASMMMSSGPAIIKESFPAESLGSSLGLVGIATACGLLAGPFISGMVVQYYDWRYIYIVSSFVGSFVFCIGFIFLRGHLPALKQQIVQKFDWQGGICWVGAALLIIALLNRIDEFRSFSTALLAAMACSLVILFVKIETNSPNPIVPLYLFRSRYYWTAVTASTISFAVLFSVLVLMPFYLEYIINASADRVGIVMMSVPATLMVCSPVSGYLYDRIGARILTSFGLFICFVALLALANLSDANSIQYICVILAMLGAGQSIFLSPNSASVLSRIEFKYLGISSGILATARNFGMVIGATLAASLFSLLYEHYSGGAALIAYTAENKEAFISAMQVSFMSLSVLALIAVGISFIRE